MCLDSGAAVISGRLLGYCLVLLYDLMMGVEAPPPSRAHAVNETDTAAFLRARDFLLQNRCDYKVAYEKFRWPKFKDFNWALDYFDIIAANNPQPALIVAGKELADQVISFAEMSKRSNQVANWFRQIGICYGDRILLMLANETATWEVILAACKIGAVIVPTSTVLAPDDLNDRLERGQVRHLQLCFL